MSLSHGMFITLYNLPMLHGMSPFHTISSVLSFYSHMLELLVKKMRNRSEASLRKMIEVICVCVCVFYDREHCHAIEFQLVHAVKFMRKENAELFWFAHHKSLSLSSITLNPLSSLSAIFTIRNRLSTITET